MIKYIPDDLAVTFAEISSEICLCFNLSLCTHRCPGCHSPYLQTDIGDELTISIVGDLINKNKGITCVLFMGGDNDKETLKTFGKYVKSRDLKSAWYSGETELDLNEYSKYFDYIKIGPYIESLGPLNIKTTNQRLYQINNETIEDITYTFWNKPEL